VIRFENVAKVYDETSLPALVDVTLDITRGEFIYLVGASGSGKSTFLQLVLREHKATSGQVLVAGKDIAALSSWKVPHLRRQMGAVFQDFRLLPNKTVYENVAFALQVIGRSRQAINQTVPETLEMVGLSGKERRRPHELSGGEQQRVAIARAFVNRPAILLADEPTGNLDPTTSLGIMRVLELINSTGTTIVMATHDDALVDEFRHRVVELDAGQVIRDEDEGSYVTSSIPVVTMGVARAGGDEDAGPEPTTVAPAAEVGGDGEDADSRSGVDSGDSESVAHGGADLDSADLDSAATNSAATDGADLDNAATNSAATDGADLDSAATGSAATGSAATEGPATDSSQADATPHPNPGTAPQSDPAGSDTAPQTPRSRREARPKKRGLFRRG
jgi:cell division transport system ATP-binding protein